MPTLLGHYNARAKKLQLPSDRVVSGLNKTLISIVENNTQVRLEMYYGTGDQAIAGQILFVAHHFKKKHIKPEQPKYSELCDLVLHLESPEVFRTATSHAADGGYKVGYESIKKVLDAAKKGYFSHLLLQNEFLRYVSRASKYISTDLVFVKKL